ncbi:hypothetical protein NDU88_008227 [Pleurodeles waltl]|uniref:Uncharacterized protein n=1 Tax=Pleurodeles waltl TaxID=8319 RepID=A0AAV7RUL5_PLEWA|nr:hypothetical protein NDU88_008227 [Pleurodeles waltl]
MRCPSGEAARADTAASNPERESVASNPLPLPGPTGQRQTVRAPGRLEEQRTPVGRERRPEGAGVTAEEDGRLFQRPETIQDSSDLGKRTESDQKGSTAPTAAREVHCEVSSHASREAWPNQVRQSYS